ncbi:MAG: periplasmic heavy metal sensor [Deferrisomatales bacterium]|nr:periplasmic heavy metal sensor [Deferrisomatales bacterium]
MVRWSAVLCVLGVAAAALPAVHAEGPSPRVGRGGCVELEALRLSEGQGTAVREAEVRFRPAFDALRNQLMARRMELEALLRDPEAGRGEIRAKAAEVSDLRRRLEETLLEHVLEVRAFLEPEQVRRWCASAPGRGRGGPGLWRER